MNTLAAASTLRAPLPWFLRFKAVPNPTMRLFCFPYAGGSATVFRRWVNLLDARIELLGVQLPGRGARMSEDPIVDFEQLVGELAGAVRQEVVGRRFAFFGHSMGGLLMFEVARRLAKQGYAQPSILLASGCAAPHIPRKKQARHALNDAEFVEELRRMEGTPREILECPEILALLMPNIRGDFALIDNWRFVPSAPLDVPLVALAGRQDAHVTPSAVAAWSEWTYSRFNFSTYLGGHFFLHEQEREVVRDVDENLQACIAGG